MIRNFRYHGLVRRPHPMLALVDTDGIGRQIWTLGRLRKSSRCAICDEWMQKGAAAFRPMTNLDNRSSRIHERHFEEPAEPQAQGARP